MKNRLLLLLVILSFYTTQSYCQNFTTDIIVSSGGGAELNLLNTSSNIQWQVVSGYSGGLEIGNVSAGLIDGSAPFLLKQSGDLRLNGELEIKNDLMIRHHQSGGINLNRITMTKEVGKGLFLTGGGYSNDSDWGGISSGVVHDMGTYTAKSDAASAIEFKNGHIYMRTADGLTENSNFTFQRRLSIAPDGKVGIGTSDFSGNHKLRVEGSIGAREIKVEASGWSDFVFYDDYKLPTLEEVEQHIAEKGHLPEIPSEAEVSENGIKLGEMNAKLLQKIEELTLYMIDLNKEVKQLKSENQQLKEKVNSLENE